MNKTKFFRYLHIYVSLFFLPVALLYALSGVAYILGADENILATNQTYTAQGIQLVQGNEQAQILGILAAQGIKAPASTSVRADRKRGGVTMGGVHYSVNAKPQGGDLLITATTRSLLGDIILLHKDKGGWYFSILAVGFGVTLVLLYLSGLMITLFASKKDRTPQLIVLALGVLACLILGYASV